MDELRVLLVDDDAVVQKLLRRQLLRLGHQVTTAWNGREALDLLRMQFFDAILMDCQMPVMDGYEATRCLRRPAGGALDPQVRVIALTAHEASENWDQCIAAGMDDHVEKPVDSKRLQEVLGKKHTSPTTGPAAPIDAVPFDRDSDIDLTLLREVCAQDESFMANLLATFQESSKELMASMESAAARGAVDEVKRLAHQLTGAASSMCAFPLAAAAMAAAAGRPEAQSDLLLRLRAAWTRLSGQLSLLLRPVDEAPWGRGWS
jgi:CheY-like chemotaxis protein